MVWVPIEPDQGLVDSYITAHDSVTLTQYTNYLLTNRTNYD
jgi:hypothetical protein